MMKIMDKGLTVPKWVFSQKYPKCPKSYSSDLPNWPKRLGYRSRKGFIGRP